MRKQNLTEEIYRMRKLMKFDSKEFNENVTSLDRLVEESLRKNLLNEENENLPSVNKSVEFAPGFYRMKGSFTSPNGTKWDWDVEKSLTPELQKIKEFLTKNPKGYIVNVKLSAGESQIPNVDREKNGVRVKPGHLSKNRMNTIKTYIENVFNSWVKEGVIKDKINFDISDPKIGDTKWVGQPFCLEKNRKGDPEGYKCLSSYYDDPNYESLKNQYTSEQFLNVSITVDSPPPLPRTGDCATGLEIIVETPSHNCNNAEFFIFANKTLLKNEDGGETHNGSNSDSNVSFKNGTLDSRVLNPGYGKLDTKKYGVNGDLKGRRNDKFIITPEQSKKITEQSEDGTMKIWAICVKNKCHSDLVTVTIKHPSKSENVFGPQKVKSNKSILTILSPCGDVALTDIDPGSLEKDSPDVQTFRGKWFKERLELSNKLNKGKKPEGNLDFKSTQLFRTEQISDLVDDYINDIYELFDVAKNKDFTDEKKVTWFVENFNVLQNGWKTIYRKLVKGNDKDPTFQMKEGGKQLSLDGNSFKFIDRWVRKDKLSGDIRNDMYNIYTVLNQIFRPLNLVIGTLVLKKGIGENIYKRLKSGKKLKKVRDIKVADGMSDKSIQIK